MQPADDDIRKEAQKPKSSLSYADMLEVDGRAKCGQGVYGDSLNIYFVCWRRSGREEVSFLEMPTFFSLFYCFRFPYV